MKTLIEIFQWQYEGEYEQYFYAIDNEEVFIKEMMKHLNTVEIKEEFPWSDPLGSYKQEFAVKKCLEGTEHLRETYFLDFDHGSNFTLNKRITEYKHERIK